MTQHLRGRVRILRYVNTTPRPNRWRWGAVAAPVYKPVWQWEVINTTTGQVVAYDNACRPSVGAAVDEAARLTALCREVARREIRLKTLREARSVTGAEVDHPGEGDR